MDELLEQFVLEGQELVQQACLDLLALGQDGYDAARTDSAFRALHTLKGSVGLFDLGPMGEALHAAEDLMAVLRQAGQSPAEAALDALLDCLGTTEGWLDSLAATGRLPDTAGRRAHGLAQALRAAAHPGSESITARSYSDRSGRDDAWLTVLRAADPQGLARTALRYVPDARCFFLGDDPLALVRDIAGLLALRIEPRTPWPREGLDPFACNIVISLLSTASAATVEAAFRLVADQVVLVALDDDPGPAWQAGAATVPVRPPPADRTLRVAAERIDTLAGLVDGLVDAKNRLAHRSAQAGATPDLAHGLAHDLATTHAELDRLAGLMHQAVMGLRMVALDQVLRRLPRLVRETALRLGRTVRFTMEGGHVQADKATVDALFEPLLHLLRNAVDHGIEPPQRRLASGKPAEGTVVLRAAQQDGQVVLTLEDDGAGIDLDALRRSAAGRGLASADSLAAMDDAAVAALAFLPGLSTAGSVSETSGRGVGMDAVRAAIHALGGQVAIGAGARGGTRVRIAVPQTLALTPVVTMRAGGQVFALPAGMVAQAARVQRGAITAVRDGFAFVSRGRTLPLVCLADRLGRTPQAAGPVAQVLVAEAGGHCVGLEVDGFGRRMDVVVQAVPALLAGVPALRGTALLGDGSVLLVLDLEALLGWA